MKAVTAEKLKELVDLANNVPEAYRQKCFELLLSHTLKSLVPPLPTGPPSPTPLPPPPPDLVSKPFILPIDVKAFLSQYGLDEAILWKLFFVDGEEIRPVYKLKDISKAKVQIKYAFLMALESALLTGQFKVDIEVLRNRCIDNKCYDQANFMRAIKSNKGYFKTIEKDQHLTLSPEGKTELADIIEGLVA